MRPDGFVEIDALCFKMRERVANVEDVVRHDERRFETYETNEDGRKTWIRARDGVNLEDCGVELHLLRTPPFDCFALNPPRRGATLDRDPDAALPELPTVRTQPQSRFPPAASRPATAPAATRAETATAAAPAAAETMAPGRAGGSAQQSHATATSQSTKHSGALTDDDLMDLVTQVDRLKAENDQLKQQLQWYKDTCTCKASHG